MNDISQLIAFLNFVRAHHVGCDAYSTKAKGYVFSLWCVSCSKRLDVDELSVETSRKVYGLLKSYIPHGTAEDHVQRLVSQLQLTATVH